MNETDMIWKLKDVKEHKTMWRFCPQDFREIFIDKSGRSFYNSLLNELIFEMSHIKDNRLDISNTGWTSTVTPMTPEEVEGYLEWSNRNNNYDPMEAWNLLQPEDQTDIFGDSEEAFTEWFTNLEAPELDFYIDRITSALPLIAKENRLPEHLPAQSYKIDSLTVAIINDKLAITSCDLEALDILKQVFVKKGNLPCEHRIKSIAERTFHTYIFKLNTKG
jgi:hypothetical protein